ncbi:hypothetical protein [Streptomyces buecherae]|uniref:Uncharacterized protein n=1 Tax=Streptomyces buecherae TaxID=2763006 RepID=A0A7H8NGG6_9ACTN|nr:hypothetical protein [Streptomyces buecherae]QKW53597.1 hypothetical protein HUT08_33155 [Streptomyces buecherae]
MPSITAAGRTDSSKGWQEDPDYQGKGIFIDVDTTGNGFNGAFETPIYVTSLGGEGAMWRAVGSSAVYRPTETGFRLYPRHYESSDLTPATAAQFNWYVNWHGTQNF